MNAEDLMLKAHQAVASARVLLDAGDPDGACNRAPRDAPGTSAAELVREVRGARY